MSNISQTNGQSSGYPPHPYRPSGPPRLREARGIGPSLFSRQPSFVKFFRQSAEGQKTPRKEPTDLPQAHCGAREKDHLAGGRRRYTPRPPATQELFGRYCGNYVFSTEPCRAPDELGENCRLRQVLTGSQAIRHQKGRVLEHIYPLRRNPLP